VGNGRGLTWHHGSIPDYYPHANNPASRNAYWDGPLAMTALCPCITGTLDEHSEECGEHKVDKEYKQSRPNPPLPQLIPSIFKLSKRGTSSYGKCRCRLSMTQGSYPLRFNWSYQVTLGSSISPGRNHLQTHSSSDDRRMSDPSAGKQMSLTTELW
jgi:hypothetical protein